MSSRLHVYVGLGPMPISLRVSGYTEIVEGDVATTTEVEFEHGKVKLHYNNIGTLVGMEVKGAMHVVDMEVLKRMTCDECD